MASASPHISNEEKIFLKNYETMLPLLKSNLSTLLSLALAKGFISSDQMMNISTRSVDFNRIQRGGMLLNVLLRKVITTDIINPSKLIEEFFESLENADLKDMKIFLKEKYIMKRSSGVKYPERDVLIENNDKISQTLRFNLDPVASRLYASGTLTDAEYRTVMNPHENHDEAAIRVIMNNIHECIRSRPDENMKKLIEILEDIGGPLTEAAKTMERDLGPSRRF
jgi:hypothetical protein